MPHDPGMCSPRARGEPNVEGANARQPRAALRALPSVLMGAGTNAQCKQHNNTDPDYQNRKRYRIMIEPVPALYTHDATSIPE
jgi:hypothetical protein